MRRLPASLFALTLGLGAAACAVNMGRPSEIPLSVVALRAGNAPATDVAGALMDVDAALVAAPADSAWFQTLAEVTGLTLSGPAAADGLRFAFLAGEPLGDSTVVLPYDGGQLTVHDALYAPEEERYLDLMMFQVEDAAGARPATAALLEYMATDVMNSAAVVLAVMVPSPAVGDSVARMLSPAYFDALRCESGVAPPEEREGIRLFYGPEARVYCSEAAGRAAAAGHMVRASLVMGRR